MLLEPRFDAEATAARLTFGRALMRHTAARTGRSSELLLSTSASPQLAAVQSGLVALVDALVAEPTSASLSIHIQTQLQTPQRTAAAVVPAARANGH